MYACDGGGEGKKARDSSARKPLARFFYFGSGERITIFGEYIGLDYKFINLESCFRELLERYFHTSSPKF
jgi:hypothetical protein